MRTPKITAAPVVDEYLATIMAAEPDPVEALALDQATTKGVWTIGPIVPDPIKHGRVVKLACGHYTLSRARFRARCQRCGQMIRAGYDHDGYRRLGIPDRFSWPDDPFRHVHEVQRDELTSKAPII